MKLSRVNFFFSVVVRVIISDTFSSMWKLLDRFDHTILDGIGLNSSTRHRSHISVDSKRYIRFLDYIIFLAKSVVVAICLFRAYRCGVRLWHFRRHDPGIFCESPLEILIHLDCRSLLQLAQASKKWRNFIQYENLLWYRLIERDFPKIVRGAFRQSSLSGYDIYRIKYLTYKRLFPTFRAKHKRKSFDHSDIVHEEFLNTISSLVGLLVILIKALLFFLTFPAFMIICVAHSNVALSSRANQTVWACRRSYGTLSWKGDCAVKLWTKFLLQVVLAVAELVLEMVR